MHPLVHVAAPSRLHFGLWSLGASGGRNATEGVPYSAREVRTVRQFGGVGAMIDRPGIRLSIIPAAALAAIGPLAERALIFARRWAEFHACDPPRCSIRIDSAPPQHVGLGTGTQLALSVAAGLSALAGLPDQTPQELALSVGRGLRSAVGTYGFVMGGLVVEQGKLPCEPISPLDCRIDLPPDWRFILVRPTNITGLAGEDESAAMSQLPSVPSEVTAELIAEASQRLVPAAATADFPAFAGSVYRYGRRSGQCFAARQGGPYNGPVLTALVESIRSLGYEGVGQSSWGPTLFVAVPSQADAESLAGHLSEYRAAGQLEMQIARPCNSGARIEVHNTG